MEPDYFTYIILLNFSELLRVVLIILEMRNWRLRKFYRLGANSHRKWSDKNLNACLLTPNLMPGPPRMKSCISHPWNETQCQSESRACVSVSISYFLFWLCPLNAQTRLKRVMGSGSLSLGIWCCNSVFTLHLLLIMDKSWVLSLALNLSIGRVGNDPNPTPRNCMSDRFAFL